jgi:RND family efflux transporter MFP subunit
MRSSAALLCFLLVVVITLVIGESCLWAADAIAPKIDARRFDGKTPVPAVGSVPSTQSFTGITVPNKRSQHSLKVPGVIREINVKPGDRVKKDDVLIALDDREEQKNLAYLKVDADSENTIRTAEKISEARKVEFDRIQKLFDEKVETEQDVTKAKLDWEVAVYDIQKAKDEHSQKIFAYERQKELLESMRIRANFDGIVQDLSVELGEVIDPNRQAGALVLVNNDPLNIEVWIPSEISTSLKLGQMLEVQDSRGRAAGKGTIIFLDPVVDASADRQRVRLELPNPLGKPAGLQVEVIVPPVSVTAAAGNE